MNGSLATRPAGAVALLPRVMRWIRRSRAPVIYLVVLLLLAVVALTAPWLTPYGPNEFELINRMKPPFFMEGGSLAFPLGTDSLGRDVLTLLVYGSRISLLVGLVAVLVGASIGLLLGLISGYYGGFIDNLVMRVADVQLAFPFILLAIALMAVLGAGIGNVILVLSLRSWVTYSRVVRGEVLVLKQREFIQAANALGATGVRIHLKHLLPNVLASVIVIASFSVAQTIIAESSLSFLGLGVDAATPTWGSLIAAGKDHLTSAWWISAFPGLAIALTVLSVNMVGDWLRDYLDPRLSN